MKELKLTIGHKGYNRNLENYKILNKFVQENFDALYNGAVKAGCDIPEDCYAPRRISDDNISETGWVRGSRFNPDCVKICGKWHSYHDHESKLTEDDILECYEFIIKLIEAHEEPINSVLLISISKR